MGVQYLSDCWDARHHAYMRVAVGKISFRRLLDGSGDWMISDGTSQMRVPADAACVFSALVREAGGPLVRPSTTFWLGKDAEG